MKISRDLHDRFIKWAIPLVTCAYFIQSYLYLKYGPEGFSNEVVAFMGIGLVGVFLYYNFYHRFHSAFFDSNYFEVSFFGNSHSYAYREIESVGIKENFWNFGDVIIRMSDGSRLVLSYIDDPANVRRFIMAKL